MAEWTDWADGNDLAGMTRSGSPLSDAGYDVDSLRANPQQRTQAMEAMAAPYVLATQPQPRASSGATSAPAATMPQPGMAATPPMATPPRMGQPAASAAPPPPTANDVTSLDAAGREAIRQSLALGQAEAQRAEKIAANPAPDTSALEAKIGQESVPTPYRDAGGKPLPQYAPSTLGKIGRGLKGAALGFFEGGPFGLGVGAVDPGLVRGGTEYGAPNRAYESVDAARQTQLGQDTQSLQNLRDRWKDMVQSNKDVTAASTGANAALGNTVKGVEDLTPKASSMQKPMAGAGPDGSPVFGTPDGSGGFIGADGKKLASFAPLPPAPKAATDAFDQWKSDPADYEKFERALAAAKASVPAKNASFMNVYAAYRMMQMGYQENPALLKILGPVLLNALGGEKALGPDAAAILSGVPLDQPLSPTTGQPIGTHMPGAPTGGTRSQAQTADRVLTELPRVRQSIAALGPELGPTLGRWNEFLTGSVGAGDPKYEQLRTDIQFVNAAAAKFHLNSVRAVDEFNKLASTGKMTPEVLQGYLNAVDDWAKTAKNQESGYGERGNKPPAAGQPNSGGNFDWGAGFHPLPAGKQ